MRPSKSVGAPFHRSVVTQQDLCQRLINPAHGRNQLPYLVSTSIHANVSEVERALSQFEPIIASVELF